MDSEEQRTKKQMYLKTEILDRAYDGYAFQEFLNSKKPEGGTNIDLWGFDELCEVVKEFRYLQDKPKTAFIKKSEDLPPSTASQIQSKIAGDSSTVWRRFSEFYNLRSYFMKCFPGTFDGEKALKPETVEQFQTSSGKALLIINDPTKKYTKSAFDLMKNSDFLYQKLAKLNKQLLMDFDQINITLFNISEIFIALHNCSLNFNNSMAEKNKITKMEDVYLTMNNLLVDWG